MSTGYVPADIIDFGVHVSFQILLFKKKENTKHAQGKNR